LIVWNRERDILEVMDSCATNEYGVFQGFLEKQAERRLLYRLSQINQPCDVCCDGLDSPEDSRGHSVYVRRTGGMDWRILLRQAPNPLPFGCKGRRKV
jgi:hypothetical protein